VAEGIVRLLALPVAQRRAMGERGRAFVQTQHSYPVLAERFLAACRRAGADAHPAGAQP
jgi:hypothetical protein